ncbi:DNA/RNA polymerase superfamily protein [Gossypium australe]|uniref:DNA/RNA polymerase superfamily protein n=1 Tax=Gossypium australe TaxID=47621 RepID=A0A5B6VLY0_9ROSI|nr:DNA/RNA polymerase superfamily protein [Gossypium australe]
MDFASGLPLTPTKKDSVWVIVDRLTKSAHFLTVRIDYSLQKFAKLYVSKIVRLHRVPASIISDRDPKLHEVLGTQLNISTMYHPQIDGQSKRVIQILKDMLWGCVIDCWGIWEDYLPLVEFAYNNNFQYSIQMASYEALYGHYFRSIKVLREYKEKRYRVFYWRSGVPISVSMEKGSSGMFSSRFIGPYRILKHVGSVAYQLELPSELDQIHNVFHVSVLRQYRSNLSHIIPVEEIEI